MDIEFNKCCFCIDLRTGCLIIGYLNLSGAIIKILMTIFRLVAAAGMLTAEDQDPSFQELNQELQRIGGILVAVTAVILVFLLVFLAFTIVLLVGLHQYKRGLVKAYLIYALIFIVLSIILFFASFGGHITSRQIIEELFQILLGIYFLLVIRSYYLKMEEPANKPIINNTA